MAAGESKALRRLQLDPTQDAIQADILQCGYSQLTGSIENVAAERVTAKIISSDYRHSSSTFANGAFRLSRKEWLNFPQKVWRILLWAKNPSVAIEE